MIGRIAAWLDNATAGDVLVDARSIDPASAATLTAEEMGDVARAQPRRRAEFATGRAVLHGITCDTTSIRIGGDGRPRLPNGWIASIAHDDEIVVAVAARAEPAIRSIGVDVEHAGALDALDATGVAGPFDHVPWSDPVAALVAKEAAFKAWAAAQPEDLRATDPDRWPHTWLDVALQHSSHSDVSVLIVTDWAAGALEVAVGQVGDRWVAVADRTW